jgi:hypothetical protein
MASVRKKNRPPDISSGLFSTFLPAAFRALTQPFALPTKKPHDIYAADPIYNLARKNSSFRVPRFQPISLLLVLLL